MACETSRMRRAVSSIVVAFGLVAAMPSNALAAAAAEPAKGQEVCKLSDEVLSELSGIAAYEDGYFVINDGSDNPAEATKVFYLDGKCKLQGNRTIEYPGEPADTEDMVLSPDGKTLWVATSVTTRASAPRSGCSRST